MARTECSPTPQGCARCQSTGGPQADPEALLLLGAKNTHAHEALRRGLDNAGVSYETQGLVLRLPVLPRRLPDLGVMLDAHVPASVQDAVRAIFFKGDLTCPISALATFLDAEPLTSLLGRLEYEWVRDALEDGWLFSQFHPIVEAHSLAPFAHEALIRALHPETGRVIGAGPILHACEQLDLQHVLDQQALQTAIRDAAGLGVSVERIFINFLPNTIYDPEICLRTTMMAAAEYGLDVSRLVFEVVETEKIPDMGRLQRILDYYRSRGVGTAVDDMGAGFSSLEYLKRLRPDFVKLDRMLVVEAEHSRTERDTMNAIIAEAKGLHIRVIAEGIETVAQMQMCREAGVDLLQGFLFARPANPPQPITRPCETLPLAA